MYKQHALVKEAEHVLHQSVQHTYYSQSELMLHHAGSVPSQTYILLWLKYKQSVGNAVVLGSIEHHLY